MKPSVWRASAGWVVGLCAAAASAAPPLAWVPAGRSAGRAPATEPAFPPAVLPPAGSPAPAGGPGRSGPAGPGGPAFPPLLPAASAGGVGSENAADVIGPGDLMDVGVGDLEAPGVETLKTVRVDEAGRASLFLVGAVRLGGLSFAEGEGLVARKYREANILPRAMVSLNRLEAGPEASVRGGGIGPGDLVRVQVFDFKAGETVRFLRVSEGGCVGVPFLGQMKVAGLGEGEAEEAIVRAFRKASFPHEMVSVLRMRAAVVAPAPPLWVEPQGESPRGPGTPPRVAVKPAERK